MEYIEELRLLKIAATNLCWMADRIHQAHHDTVPETDGDFITWKTCGKGVCGSMEHMLAQIGFDKDLKPVVVRP
jgi:hypothetical protein